MNSFLSNCLKTLLGSKINLAKSNISWINIKDKSNIRKRGGCSICNLDAKGNN